MLSTVGRGRIRGACRPQKQLVLLKLLFCISNDRPPPPLRATSWLARRPIDCGGAGRAASP